jgi:hypothetical protein
VDARWSDDVELVKDESGPSDSGGEHLDACPNDQPVIAAYLAALMNRNGISE